MGAISVKCIWLAFVLAAGAFTTAQANEDYMDSPARDDLGQKNTCAMTQVLQAMNTLLTKLREDILDLRVQVQTSCTAKDGGKKRKPTPKKDLSDMEEEEEMERGDKKMEKAGEEEEGDDIFDSFGKNDGEADGSSYDEDGDGDGSEDDGPSPADDLIEGLSSWFDAIVPFAKPTTEAPPTTTTIKPPTYLTEFEENNITGYDPYDSYPDSDDIYPDSDDIPSPNLSTPRPRFSDLPPEPTTCPPPFELKAAGCYLIFHDQRDWRSWGEAHAYCQNYGGSLASPYRLPELQKFLSQYYSHAFWVGASFDAPTQLWTWLSGLEVELDTWKEGQPNRNRAMKCIFLDKWSGYRASNHFCGEKYPFICDYRN